MRAALLPSTGAAISRLGIGGWQAGGRGPWGGGDRSDDDLAIAAIRKAVEGGVTWVETAASYGLGHSEELIARALQPWHVGEEVLVFTKCGHPWDPPDAIRTDLSPASIRRECEGSLRRLGVDRIDLLHFHHVDSATPIEASWSTMAELVEEGKVRWAGVSNFPVALLDRCQSIRQVDSVQLELNLLRPAATKDIVPWCREHRAGVISYSPMASGLLSGTHDRDAIAAMSSESRRGLTPETIVDLVDDVRQVAERLETTVAAVAVAWILQIEGVTAAICGARTPEQVEAWLPAADLELDLEAVAAIEAGLGRSSGA